MAVDDLFDGPGPQARPNPRRGLSWWLIASGVLVLAGPFCCTGPLGAFVSFFTWMRAGDELARGEAGLVQGVDLATARTVRQGSFGLMVVSLVSLSLEIAFFDMYRGVAQRFVTTVWPVLVELFMLLTSP